MPHEASRTRVSLYGISWGKWHALHLSAAASVGSQLNQDIPAEFGMTGTARAVSASDVRSEQAPSHHQFLYYLFNRPLVSSTFRKHNELQFDTHVTRVLRQR